MQFKPCKFRQGLKYRGNVSGANMSLESGYSCGETCAGGCLGREKSSQLSSELLGGLMVMTLNWLLQQEHLGSRNVACPLQQPTDGFGGCWPLGVR